MSGLLGLLGFPGLFLPTPEISRRQGDRATGESVAMASLFACRQSEILETDRNSARNPSNPSSQQEQVPGDREPAAT